MLKELRLDNHAPWKERFRTPSILWAQLAQMMLERGLVASNRSGVLQLYAWQVADGELKQLTHHSDGKMVGTISSDGRYVYYHQDQQGNEIGHFVRVPFEGGAPEDITPELAPYAAFMLTSSASGNMLSFAAGTPQGFHVYTLEVRPAGELGDPQLLYEASRLVHGPTLSHNGEIAVVDSTERSGSLRCHLLALDTATKHIIGELEDGDGNLLSSSFSPVAGDFRLLATSDSSGVARPFIWNPRTGERSELSLDGLQGEVTPLSWSKDGKQVLLCHFIQAVQHLYIYDLDQQILQSLDYPAGSFPNMGRLGADFGPEHEVFVQWQDATHPSRLIALDSKTGKQTRTVLAAGEAPVGRPWKSIHFPSFDGEIIQGWLALPEGEGPFPTILETHGGPTAVTTEAFSAGSQAWLDSGFAFLSINYHGSTTFGRAFERKLWGDLGHWEVEDMVAARSWLIEQGITKTDQILLTGWSYGGYLTLLALGKQPKLWAGGMAGVAIADWAIQYEDTADTLRNYQVALFGGTPQEKPEAYAASSPITYAEHVSAPVLIIQGRNDTRTPARPIEMYEAKMKAMGKDIEVRWFDSGHLGSFAQVEQSIEHQQWMLQFAHRILS